MFWISILILYSFGWSDLCEPLTLECVIFLTLTISISLFLSHIHKEKLKYITPKQNPRKKDTVFFTLCIMYILNFLVARSIPLVEVVLYGYSYRDLESFGIPHTTLFLNAFSIFYCMYLSYIYAFYKQRKVLVEIFVIIGYFLLLMSRQYVFVCGAFFINTLFFAYSSKIKRKFAVQKYTNAVIMIVFGLILLYLMGVFGNMRYGAMWKWNDASMIMSLGKANESYPGWLSGLFFWSYIYLVSPLSNFNYNIIHLPVEWDFFNLIGSFIPGFISDRLGINLAVVYLPIPSLNVSTGFAGPYKHFGIIGSILASMAYLFLSAFIIRICKKYRPENMVFVCNGLLYFVLLTFFQNTFWFPTTWLVMFFCFISSLKFRGIKRLRIK